MRDDEITQQLVGIASGLRADNYDLRVISAAPDALALSVAALEGACEDCLVPAAVLSRVVSAALDGQYAPAQIAIDYR